MPGDPVGVKSNGTSRGRLVPGGRNGGRLELASLRVVEATEGTKRVRARRGGEGNGESPGPVGQRNGSVRVSPSVG